MNGSQRLTNKRWIWEEGGGRKKLKSAFRHSSHGKQKRSMTKRGRWFSYISRTATPYLGRSTDVRLT
ncbi:hypothetical protein [Pseudacidobacterium ailaaui]|uniref:hypothetical protein n=1 Tax=Pseudacidobacterium ailaaui TaxID=1382359 RepID=UPI003D809B90